MAVLAALKTDLTWGLVLVTDATSTEEIPELSEAGDGIVTAMDTGLIVRVQHPNDGLVRVRVVDAEANATGDQVFDGELTIPSGRLRVSGVLQDSFVEVRTASTSPVRVKVFVDAPQASLLDIVLEPQHRARPHDVRDPR